MSYRVGLVGTGGIARAHGSACQQIEEADLVAIYDVSKEQLASYGEEFAVEARYTDLDEMLAKENLDIVVICTWGCFHAEVGIQICNSGNVKAVLCEKPFTQTASEAESFVAAGKANGVLVAEAFKFRHHPMHLKAQEMIEAGAIGDLLNVRSTFCTNSGRPVSDRTPESNWRFNKAKGGGSIYDLACYNIHHARAVFGEDPVRVFASQELGIEADDAASIMLAFSSGRTAQISVGFNSFNSQYAEISGHEGLLRLDSVWNNENRAVNIEHKTQDGVQVIEFDACFQFAEQLRHMCECLETGRVHRISGAHSIAQMRVLDAVKLSMESGVAVEL
ncbi:MAG TPA: Gfo/Idh/MocA family oxidoreductase [Candidatus Latescibacteria bacterium]|nr:Gfo/Idh/MocA family oxidoreductase [Candidatus Latescibacterota bacterium]